MIVFPLLGMKKTKFTQSKLIWVCLQNIGKWAQMFGAFEWSYMGEERAKIIEGTSVCRACVCVKEMLYGSSHAPKKQPVFIY